MIKYLLDTHYKYYTTITQLSVSIIVVFKTNSCEPFHTNSGCPLPKKLGQTWFRVTFLFTGIKIGKNIHDKDPTDLIFYALSFGQIFPTFMKIVLPSY